MTDELVRPSEPRELREGTIEHFALRRLVEQLMAEDTFVSTGRDALTLVHAPTLSVVLTVARRGTACDVHQVPTAALIVCLVGAIVVARADGDVAVHLEEGAAAGMAPDTLHVLRAESDCAFLTVLAPP